MKPVRDFSQQTPSSVRFLLHGSIAEGKQSSGVKVRNEPLSTDKSTLLNKDALSQSPKK